MKEGLAREGGQSVEDHSAVPTRRRRRWGASAVVLVVAIGASATVGASVLWHRSLVGTNTVVVRHEASQLDASVASTLSRYEDLVAVMGQELGSHSLDAAQFAAQVDALHLRSHYPGLGAVGFVAYVPASSLSRFVASQRAQGDSGYQVAPSGARSDYCLETVADWPLGTAPHDLAGLDLCALPAVRSTMLAAARTGRTGITAGKDVIAPLASDLFITTPSYRGSPDSAEARGNALVGWAAAAVTTSGLFQAAGVPRNGPFAVSLYRGAKASAGSLAASVRPGRRAVVGTVTDTVDAGGKWTIRTAVLAGAPGVVSTWTVPLVVLAGGLLLVAAIAGLAWSLTRSRREAERSAVLSHLARERSETRFASIATASPIGIIETTDALEITYANPRFAAIAERPANEMLGARWTDLVHPDDLPSLVAMARGASDRRRELTSSFRILRPSGEVRTVRVMTTVGHYDEEARANRYVVSVDDVSEEVALQRQLRHQALRDTLTRLPNRTLFMDRLGQAIERSRRNERQAAVLFLDLDRFKVVNDSLGHTAGDQLLVQLADRLRHCTRRGETVARLGGDEFAVLLPEASGAADAVMVAERVMRSLEDPFQVQGRDIVVGASIGIALSERGDDPDTTLRAADAAMYWAKEDGPGGFAIFNEHMHQRSLEHLTIETEIRQGIKRGEFEVYFQPVIDLGSDDMVGVEALVRWHHPRRGLLLPDAFIPVAEETGLIVPLGQWVWGAALAQVAAFDADPTGPRIDTLAINLSSHQLRSPDLSRERQALCAQHGIDLRRICIELTETVIMDENETTQGTLRAASQAGLHVAIDDFGTGYSSLAYLQSLPVDTLKIDRRFTLGVGSDREADAIVAAIIEMAHHLGLGVVAEGVEDEAQHQRLVELGCDQAQGFLWSRPLPAAKLSGWCAERPRIPA